MEEIKVGVLGLQGAVSEHIEALEKALDELGLEGQAITVKTLGQLEEVNGLVIPGGESTTIGRLAVKGLAPKIIERATGGMPIFGTCAGLVLMAKEVYDAKLGRSNQPTLGLMNVRVIRNFFGRQKESFEVPLMISVLGNEPFPGVFIRAPIVKEFWGNVEPLCMYKGNVVAVKQEKLLATSFHPELTSDLRFHKYFLKLILDTTF